MSLGKPDLYIGGQLMQTAKTDPRPALAGLRISWGTDDRLDFDPAAKLSGQLLIKGAMPTFLEVGAPVGLVDPISGRCLFAGNLAPLKAVNDERVQGARRVSFTAASPLAELIKHRLVGHFDWPHEETAASRRGRLAGSMPRGWGFDGAAGWTWIHQGRQRYADGRGVDWVELLSRYVRSYNLRYHDTSAYTPGAGLGKRITLTTERGKTWAGNGTAAGTRGAWSTSALPAGASGIAVLPASVIHQDIEWEKTPGDVVTDVQVSSWGVADPFDTQEEPWEFQYGMTVNNNAQQDLYGYRQAKIETALSAFNANAFTAAVNNDITPYWLDTKTAWRPTALLLPDSRKLDAAPLLNLLATNTRHMAVVSVPGAPAGPGLIRSFVMAGTATWTGKKWETDLTLGRTL